MVGAYPRFGGQPAFITSVPFTDAYREGEQRSEASRANDLAARRSELELKNAERSAQQEQAIDAAVRGAIQPQSPMPTAPAAAPGAPGEQPGTEVSPGGGMRQIGGGPVTQTAQGAPVAPPPSASPMPQAGPSVTSRAMTALAATPGGGKAALALAQQQEKQRDDAETRMMERLADGDVQGGQYWATKAGANIPPELLQNASFWQGTKMAKQFYGDDMERGHKFAQAYVTAQGDPIARMQAGIAQAGPPVNRVSWTTVTMEDGVYQVNPYTGQRRLIGQAYRAPTFLTGQDGALFTLKPGNQQVQPVTTSTGEPFKGSKFGARPGAGGGTVDFIAQKLMAEDPSLSYAEAVGLARRAPNDQTLPLERLALQAAKQDRNFRRDPDGTLAHWRQRYGLPAEQEGAPAPANPNPTQTAQHPVAPQAPAATVPSGGGAIPPTYSEGDVNGTFTGQFSDGKPVYQTPDGRQFVVE